MNSGSRDEKGSNQELVSLKGLGAREQDPKSRQMAFVWRSTEGPSTLRPSDYLTLGRAEEVEGKE